MKRLLQVSILWLPTLVCSAQRITQEQFFLANGLVDIQSGVSVPVGDFALSNFTLPAGYAQTGYHIKGGMNYDITPYLGFAIQYQYIENAFNSKDYLSDLQKLPPSIISHSYKSDPWKLNGLSLGLYYPFKAAKTTIDVRLLGGIFSGVLPESEHNVTYTNQNNQRRNLKYTETKASNLGFQAGFKIRYQLYKRLVVSSSIDYTQANIHFENILIVDTYTNESARGNDYSQKFQLFNFSAGLGIQFN